MSKLTHLVMWCCVFLSAEIVQGSVLAQDTNSTGQLLQDAKHCGMGDVTAALENAPLGFAYASNWPTNIKIAGLGATPNCQFRLFLTAKPTNGERFTFCEEDLFLGGVVYRDDYFDVGISRQVAIEDLEQIETTVWFGPLNGTLLQKSIMQIGYKNYVDPIIGNVVYRQDAFVTQEQPGIYEWVFEPSYMGITFSHVSGTLEIVSHDEHLNRVQNGTWHTW